jgi:Uma2 family endonuclease
MTATIASPTTVEGEQRLVLSRIRWEEYVAIADALPDRPNLRLIYSNRSLTFVTTSHRHEWIAERLGLIIMAVASGCGIECEPAGPTTFRREDADAGAEGDKTFYFGPNAERMRGPREIDLSVDPPPDLVVEVEVSNPADPVMITWARLGVPEVWRYDANRGVLTVWNSREDGTFGRSDRSTFLPMIEAADVIEQLRLAEELGSSRWYAQLVDWVRDVVLPRGR